VQAHDLSAAHAALIATAPGLSRGHSRSASRQDNLSVHLMKKHLFISLATAVMSIMTAGAAAERTPPLTPTAKAATEAAASPLTHTCDATAPHKYRIAYWYAGGRSGKDEIGAGSGFWCLEREIKSEVDWYWLQSRIESDPKTTVVTIMSATLIRD
jgi:hypothetical protein